MNQAQHADAFLARWNGRRVDEDGYYGTQCWDLPARYAREEYGCPSFPTGSGGAEGVYRLFGGVIPQYFDRIANDPKDPNQLPQKGDIIVWNANFFPPYGHIAIVLAASPQSITVFEQNGATDDGVNRDGNTNARKGDGIADGVAYQITRAWSPHVAGWLRPKVKEEGMANLSTHEARMIYLEYGYDVAGNDPALVNRQELELRRGIAGMVVNERNNVQNQIKGMQMTIDGLRTELDAERKGYDQQIADLKKQIDVLNGKLASVGDDTINLNKLGEALRWIITRLGVSNK